MTRIPVKRDLIRLELGHESEQFRPAIPGRLDNHKELAFDSSACENDESDFHVFLVFL